jgi:hypothetical protein
MEKIFGEGGALAHAVPGFVPREGQITMAKTVADVLQNGGRAIIEAPTGCHVAGQGILLADGRTKFVEDVAVGDVLMGPDGGGRVVLSLARGEQCTAWIRPIKGKPWRVNLDHILTLQRTSIAKRPTKPRKDCRDGEIVDVSVRNYIGWSKTKKNIHKLIRVGVAGFHCSPHSLPISPYHLGVLLGDGVLAAGASVAICKVDPEIETTAQALAE